MKTVASARGVAGNKYLSDSRVKPPLFLSPCGDERKRQRRRQKAQRVTRKFSSNDGSSRKTLEDNNTVETERIKGYEKLIIFSTSFVSGSLIKGRRHSHGSKTFFFLFHAFSPSRCPEIRETNLLGQILKFVSSSFSKFDVAIG